MKNNSIAIVIFSYIRPDKLKNLIDDILNQNYNISKIPVILFQDNVDDFENHMLKQGELKLGLEYALFPQQGALVLKEVPIQSNLGRTCRRPVGRGRRGVG